MKRLGFERPPLTLREGLGLIGRIVADQTVQPYARYLRGDGERERSFYPQGYGKLVLEALGLAQEGRYSEHSVVLFHGYQSNDCHYRLEADNQQLLSSLYDQLCQALGRGPKTFYDISNDAWLLRQQGKVTYRHVPTVEDAAALLNSYHQLPEGVQLHVAEGVHVNFRLGNFDDPMLPGKTSTVEAIISENA